MATDTERKFSNSINAPSEAAAKAATSRRKPLPSPSPGPTLDPMIPATPDPRWGIENCCVREFWAVIDTDGYMVRGRNVARTTHLGIGTYEVFFTGEVSNGVFIATLGRPGIASDPPGEICVALRYGVGGGAYTPFDDNKGVWVQTFDSQGTLTDHSFHLLVMTH
jgi:hypothetical protein